MTGMPPERLAEIDDLARMWKIDIGLAFDDLLGEVKRLRALLDQIAVHHDEQAQAFSDPDSGDEDGETYHRERARIARGQP